MASPVVATNRCLFRTTHPTVCAGRHSLVDKRLPALNIDAVLPGIRDSLVPSADISGRDNDDDDGDNAIVAAKKKKQLEENFTLPPDNAYVAQGHFRLAVRGVMSSLLLLLLVLF